jgi:dipeptidyl aminopeptidase/acylaminoacyl peptidase
MHARLGLTMLILLVLVLLAIGALVGLGWKASGEALHPGQGAYSWQQSDFPDLAPDEVLVDSSTGAKLSGRLFRGRSHAAVVLLHGYGGNQDEMLPVADKLHDAGFTVFTYDQRGSGRSTGEVTFGAREQDDLISVVDYLASRSDVDAEKLGVFGFSMGGATALMTAAREPRLKAVVADSAWSEARRWMKPSVGAVFTRPRDRFNALSLKIAELRTGIDLDDLRPVAVIGRISPRPVMLTHGTADDVVMADESELNFGAAKEPKELHLVPGAGHGDTIAPGEPSTEAQVRDFFERALRANTVAA